MNQLEPYIRRARRRLTLQLFARSLCFSLSCTFVADALAAAADRRLGLDWPGWLLAVPPAVGMLAAVATTLLRRASRWQAACEIDRRFTLDERVASAVSLDPPTAATSAGMAVTEDALGRLKRIDIGDGFRLRPGCWLLWPALAAVPLGLVQLLVPLGEGKPADGTALAAAEKKQLDTSAESLRQKLARERKQAQEQGLTDAAALLDRLERETAALRESPKLDHKQALLKLNDLSDELKRRQQGLAGAENLQKQLEQQMQRMGAGPADNLVDALRRGDFERAARELERMRDQLAAGKMAPDERQALAKQLDGLKQKLAQMAEAQRQEAQSLEKQAAGRDSQPGEANALEEQLAKLAARSSSETLEKLASELKQSAERLDAGEPGKAGEGLDAAARELDRLSGELAENQLVSSALDQIRDTRDSMNCKSCRGAGCEHCQDQANGGGQQSARGGGHGGHGAGNEPGRDKLPGPKISVGHYDTRARQRVGHGEGQVAGFAPGPNTRGNVVEEIRRDWKAVHGSSADPLAGQRLPRDYREHAQGYFDALREGAP